MNSPVESTVELARSELDVGLTSWCCPVSGGHWVPAPSYWRWHAQLPPGLQESRQRPIEKMELPDVESQLKQPALICPESHSLLVRYKVRDLGIFIDRSPISGGIWLDDGKWGLLKEYGIHVSVHEIFTSSYQKQVLREEAHDALDHKFYNDLGEEAVEDLVNLVNWLREHPKRRRIIAWLHEQLVLDEDDIAVLRAEILEEEKLSTEVLDMTKLITNRVKSSE